MKKTILILGLGLFWMSCQTKKTEGSADVQLLQKAQQIHLNTTTLDTHDDINVQNFTDSLNYTQDTDTQVNLLKMERGALDVAWFIVYTGQGDLTPAGYEKVAVNAQAKFDAIHRLVEVYAPNKIGLARSSQEVRDLRKEGKKVAMIGVENAYPLGENLNEVKRYYDLGARYMSLAHNGHNQFSDSNTGEFDNTSKHNGISELGKQLIEKMNYLGIMVDISHPSKEAIRQTIAHSKAPVIASHSSARTLSDHPRNLDDQQLQWVKESGGVVQTVAFSSYLHSEKHNAYNKAKDSILKVVGAKHDIPVLDKYEMRALDFEALQAYISKRNELFALAVEDLEAIKTIYPPVSVSDFVDHIDYIKSKIGIDHVGISSDFDGGGGIEGWQDASETLNVTKELVKRGYTEEEIEKIWGGNLLRVMEEVEAVAKKLQAGA